MVYKISLILIARGGQASFKIIEIAYINYVYLFLGVSSIL